MGSKDSSALGGSDSGTSSHPESESELKQWTSISRLSTIVGNLVARFVELGWLKEDNDYGLTMLCSETETRPTMLKTLEYLEVTLYDHLGIHV